MFFITLYFVTLIIAPQLWIKPFVGLPTDYIMLPAWMLAVALRGRLVEFFKFRPMDWVFLAMIFWMTVSAILNPTNKATFIILADYGKFFVIYRLFVVSIPTMPHLRRVCWILLFFVMLLVLEGIQQKLHPEGIGWAGQTLGWVDPSVIAAGGTGRTRWINIFDGPGVFCVIYTIGLPIVMILMGPPFRTPMRIFGLMMFGPLMLATYYSGSRGGFLAVIAIFGFYFLMRFKVSLVKMAILAGLVTGLYVAAPSHLTAVKDENRSAQHRVEMWAQGVAMVESNPLLGIGKGNFRAWTSRLIAHNSAIEIMGETGLPGLFLWIALSYLAFKGLYLYKAGPYEPLNKAYATALQLILIGYLVSAMFVTLEYETLYFILAMCMVVAKNMTEPVLLTRQDVGIIGGITVAWVVAVKGFAMSYF